MNDCSPGVIHRKRFPGRLVSGLLLACAATAVSAQPEAASTKASTKAAQAAPSDAALQSAQAEVRRLARWVVESGDNAGLPFLLVDKVNAEVLAFNAAGELQATTPALLGMARGDRLLAPNSATMAEMRPEERITPAGRFVSRLARDSDGKQLLVLDYEAAISLHPVIKGKPEERRAERLNSATRRDNRISYGCINVPAQFYATIVAPTFTNTRGIVYVLPETAPASAMFGLDDATSRGRAISATSGAGAATTAAGHGPRAGGR